MGPPRSISGRLVPVFAKRRVEPRPEPEPRLGSLAVSLTQQADRGLAAKTLGLTEEGLMRGS